MSVCVTQFLVQFLQVRTALPFILTPVVRTPQVRMYRTQWVPVMFIFICSCACPSLRGGAGALISVAAATSEVIYRICAACTAHISASSPVVVSVTAEASSRVLTVVTLSPPPDSSSAFSASRAQAYSEKASYSALVTVPGSEKGAGVALVPRIAAADSCLLRFAAIVVAHVISSHFPRSNK